MRRTILLAAISALVLGLGVPADAAKPTKTVYDSVSANAFWTTEERISPSTVRRTTWYVGVYRATDGTFSDLYLEIATCRTTRKGEECSYEFMSGYSDLSGAVFTIDAENLTAAHLEETYELQSYDREGNPTGSFPAAIVADWSGVGEIQRSSGRSTYCDPTACYRSRFSDAWRSAEAVGTVNGQDLGETYDASLAASHYETTERRR